MKIITVSNSQLQAEMIIGYLNAQGFEAFSRGSREYASIITGSDLGRYEIVVPEAQFEQATESLQHLKHTENLDFQLINSSEESSEMVVQSEVLSASLKKMIILYVASIVFVPIVFNLLSSFHAYLYFSDGQSNDKKFRAVIFAFAIGLNIATPTLILIKRWSWFFS